MNNGSNENFQPFRHNFGSKFSNPCGEVTLGANFLQDAVRTSKNKAKLNG